jgi:cellulose synthase/poly-beta-1,6-N-acetylglucosamine synthase-like glycosyltransferase
MVEMVTYSLIFLSLYVQIFLLLGLFEGAGWRRRPGDAFVSDQELPSATIVVPCWNEEKTVGGTIESLLALDYPTEKLRIVVVDDGSTDNTLATAQHYEHDPRVTIISKENGGKFTALNHVLAHSSTDLFGALDADSFVAPDALKNAASYFQDSNIHAVTPAMNVAPARNLLSLVQRAEYALGMAIKFAYSKYNALWVTPGPFSIFRTASLKDMGGWQHAHGTEDCDIALRMQTKHLRIINGADIHVFTTVPSTVYRLYKQRVRWTYGFLMNAWDHRRIFFNRAHGALGMIILPSMVVLIGSALYAYTLLLWHAGSTIGTWAIRLYDTGFVLPKFALDWFFINTSPVALLAVMMLGCTLTFMFIGKRILGHDIRSVDALIYFTVYGLLAPLWLTAAVARVVVGKQAPWR